MNDNISAGSEDVKEREKLKEAACLAGEAASDARTCPAENALANENETERSGAEAKPWEGDNTEAAEVSGAFSGEITGIDTSFEQSVRKPDYTQDKKRYRLYNIMMYVSIAAAGMGVVFLLLGAYVFGAADIVFWAGLTVLFYHLKDGAVIEYDYEFSDGALRIARISNGEKRKELLCAECGKIESIAPLNREDIKRMAETGERKIKDYSLNDDGRKYCVLCSVKNEKLAVIWEPKQSLLRLIRREMPRSVTL